MAKGVKVVNMKGRADQHCVEENSATMGTTTNTTTTLTATATSSTSSSLSSAYSSILQATNLHLL